MVKKTCQDMKGEKKQVLFLWVGQSLFFGTLKKGLELNFKELQKTENNSTWDGKKPPKRLVF